MTDYPWVTGTTVGLKGTANSSGKFIVDQIFEPGIPQMVMPDLKRPQNEAKFVALVSGLNYGKENSASSIERNLLFDLLNGSLHVKILLQL